jgi:hypothetical protein
MATETTIETEIPIDKRSGLVDRRRAIRQVLCYICCAEFGTNSLSIHHKTCLKKHAWGLEANILNAEGVTKKQSDANFKKCSAPGSGPTLPIPNLKTPADEFEAYNKEALEIFFEHAKVCLWCREQNTAALEAAREAEEAARRKALEDEARRKAEEEEANRRAAEELEARRIREEEEARLAREASDAEALRLANEAERDRLRRLAEEAEETRRMAAEEVAMRRALAEAELLRQLAEEEAERLRLLAEEEAERHRRLVAKGQHKYLVKGGGKIASTEAGKVHQEKIIDSVAREDIANFSLSHAKKKGLIAASGAKKDEGTGVEWVYEDELEAPSTSEIQGELVEKEVTVPSPTRVTAEIAKSAAQPAQPSTLIEQAETPGTLENS